MELHHKLRRDPSWHPSACNICGQVSAGKVAARSSSQPSYRGRASTVLSGVPAAWPPSGQLLEWYNQLEADLRRGSLQAETARLRLGVRPNGKSKADQL